MLQRSSRTKNVLTPNIFLDYREWRGDWEDEKINFQQPCLSNNNCEKQRLSHVWPDQDITRKLYDLGMVIPFFIRREGVKNFKFLSVEEQGSLSINYLIILKGNMPLSLINQRGIYP